jgi:hypothetical protein
VGNGIGTPPPSGPSYWAQKNPIKYIIDHCFFISRRYFFDLREENGKILKSISLFIDLVLSNHHSNEILLENPSHWFI